MGEALVPAYLIELDHECHQEGCTQRATVKVRNTWNADMGDFCLKHGRKQVAALNQEESAGKRH